MENVLSIFTPARARYNFTNLDEPYFVLDMLELMNARLIEENDSVLIVVYAVNQKGRSIGVVIRDLELGANVKLDRGNEARSFKRRCCNYLFLFILSTETLIVAGSHDSTPYFIGIVVAILGLFTFIAFKMLSICWAGKSRKNTRASTTTTLHNEQNGTTKLTNHSNNLLIISSYNGGSLTKVSQVSFVN
jgi:hypothetical protein